MSIPERRISARERAAVYALITKSRLANGWNPMPAEEAEPMVLTWAEILNDHSVPIEYYNELFRLAERRRVAAAAAGQPVPTLDAVLLAAVWESELRDRVRTKRLEATTASTARNCDMCFGSGVRYREDYPGQKGAGYVACNHIDRTGFKDPGPKRSTSRE